MKRIYLVLVIIVLSLTSCSFGDTNMKNKSDCQMAQNRLEQLLDGIQNQDREKIINTFSENAIKESENMDESLDYLFDYFQGTVQSYDWGDNTIGPISDGLIEHGKRMVELKSWFEVTTDKERYIFFLLDYPKDEFDAKNIGLYSLRVVKTSEKEDQLTYWQDMKIPGIYKP